MHAIEPILARRIRAEAIRHGGGQRGIGQHPARGHRRQQRRRQRPARPLRPLAAGQLQPAVAQRLGRIDLGQHRHARRQQGVQPALEGP